MPCPFCGESVLAIDRKCRHCGEAIDVALRAAEEARRAAEAARREAAAPSNTVATMLDGVTQAEDGLRHVGDVGHAERLRLLRREYEAAELRAVVFGEFSRGKSTLINALLGRLVLPAKAMPTTGHVTRIAWGPSDEVRARLRGGRVETCPLVRLDSFTTLDFNRRAREDVEAIDVLVDCPLLKGGLVLYDTPGVCDPGAQTERALAAIASADLVLLVLNASQLLTQHEHELAVEWMNRGLGKPVIPLLNWMNVVEERDRAELRRRIDRWSREHLGSELGRPWFEVNAKGALAHVTDGSPVPGDDFLALREALAGLTGERRRALQASSRRGQLRAEVAEARRANGDVLRRIRQDANRVERKREEARRDLRQLLSRFDAVTRLKRDALTTRATAVLEANLDLLVGLFHGEGKERLEANSGEWYQDRLFEGVAEIEEEAEGALLALAGDGPRRPDPLTIKECMILETRLNVGELKPTGISDAVVVGAAVAGALLGQVIIPIPVVGYFAGYLAGGLLAKKLGQQEPDYAAAYSAKVRDTWKDSAAEVMRLLQEQFDARAAMLKGQIAQRLREADAVAAGADGLAVELRRREAIDGALGRCEGLLQAT
jgi:hypothetical protein